MHRIIEQGDRKLLELAEQAETDLGSLWRSAKRSIRPWM